MIGHYDLLQANDWMEKKPNDFYSVITAIGQRKSGFNCVRAAKNAAAGSKHVILIK